MREDMSIGFLTEELLHNYDIKELNNIVITSSNSKVNIAKVAHLLQVELEAKAGLKFSMDSNITDKQIVVISSFFNDENALSKCSAADVVFLIEKSYSSKCKQFNAIKDVLQRANIEISGIIIVS